MLTRHDVRRRLQRWEKLGDRIAGLRLMVRAIQDDINGVGDLKSQNLDGMPHGTTVGQPTELAALQRIALRESYRARLEELEQQIQEADRLRESLEEAVMYLMPEEAFVINRHYRDGKTYEQVAEEQDCDVSTVKRRERRAVALIAEFIDTYIDFEEVTAWKN
jgi:RNA polymerase sigma factor (sigma-70 family)